jgi:hypothetical protein
MSSDEMETERYSRRKKSPAKHLEHNKSGDGPDEPACVLACNGELRAGVPRRQTQFTSIGARSRE